MELAINGYATFKADSHTTQGSAWFAGYGSPKQGLARNHDRGRNHRTGANSDQSAVNQDCDWLRHALSLPQACPEDTASAESPRYG